MIDLIGEHIRTTVLGAAAGDLSAPIDRTFLAPGEGWAREGCRTWVVHYVATRWEAVGGGRVPAQQGAGLAGPIASAPTHDFMATFVACGHPTSTTAEPVDAAATTAWTLAFLADVAVFGALLAALTLPPGLSQVPGQKLSLGASQPAGPGQAGAGIARVHWPISASVF